MKTLRDVVSAVLLLAIFALTRVHGGGLLDGCLTNADCDPGLQCGDCKFGGALSLRCIREQATPLSNISSLPFNKVSWVVTHNSFAIAGFPEETGPRITFTNQEDNITNQLNNGVRGLMLDTYDFQNDVWLCHSFGGVCYDYTSFGPLLNALVEVQKFLAANPTEIITIILEDYVKAPNGLTKVFTAANLTQYWFPVASMPTNGADWPTIDTMIKNNWRLLVFTSQLSKQATEGIAYQWGYMNENQYGNDGMVTGNCPNRAESKPMNDTGVSLILQNYFRTDPIEADSCKDNSDPLYSQIPVCYAASGKRWANFLAIDFYKKSTGGGVFQALDRLNGQLECECSSPVSCQTRTSPLACPADPSLAEFHASFVPRQPRPPSGNASSSSSLAAVRGRLPLPVPVVVNSAARLPAKMFIAVIALPFTLWALC